MPPICSRLASSLAERGERPADGLSFHGKSWTRTFFTDKNFNSFRRRRRDKEEKFVVFCGDGCFKRQRARPGKSYVPPPLLPFSSSSYSSSFFKFVPNLGNHFRTLLLPFLPSSYFHSFNFQMKGFILASRTSSETKLVLLNKLPRLFPL